MCTCNTNTCCNNNCKYTGSNFSFLGVENGDNVSNVLSSIMEYIDASNLFSSIEGESGIVLYDGTEYITPTTVSSVVLDLQTMGDGDTYTLEFVVESLFSNLTLELTGLSFQFLSETLSFTAPYKAKVNFSKNGAVLLGDYSIASLGGSHEAFEGTFTNTGLMANNTLSINFKTTHSTETVNLSKIRNIVFKFFKQLS